MNWFNLYRDRVVSAEQAVTHIQSHQRIFLSGNCSVPRTVLAALVARAPRLENVEICQVLTVGPADYVSPEMAGHLRVNTLFISDNVRAAVNEGRADFTPCFLSEIPGLFKSGRLPLDVALIQVSPPDDHGFCSYGVEVGVTKTAAQSAKCVIAEINPNMPRTLGDSFIHISKINVMVPVNYLLPEVKMAAENDPISERIADHVAALIPDGATLQTGIGAIPDAVLSRLKDRRDLGIHTELFSDGIIDLVNCGVITGERKTLHPGKITAGFLLGTQRLYDFVNDNPIVELHPTEYVNDPFVIAQNDNMIAINSAIEVDLTGQVCADSIGPRLYSGVGGQVDFIYGASRSKGGKPIIALPSTLVKKDGTKVSKITAMLKPGAGVTTTRNHVHYVVTEHGVADLYGKTIAQRAEALIAIAAPEFRDELTQQAKELKYL
ncbi:MAG: acetyl-CoA hydrolase/transferase C-terminal domain-containing protein [Anaerolineales bacterium]|nr:acetyl-CoA hydrolase/transferase C-terminal domain-containing protein [Anaerolineales bacterium]